MDLELTANFRGELMRARGLEKTRFAPLSRIAASIQF